MTVLSVGYPLFPIAPDTGGGAEQILCLLERELVRAGQTSVVIGAQGSQVAGELIETPLLGGEITDVEKELAIGEHQNAIKYALRSRPIDIVHFHGLDFHHYIPESRVPMLATLHLPLAWYPESIFQQSAFPEATVHLNCVSQSQAAETSLPVVLNGIATWRFAAEPPKQDYLLWLGRICPEKGVHLALQTAHNANMRLFIAGPVHPFATHQQYFHEQVEPLLDDKRKYVGNVKGAEKNRLLAEARCLLVTSSVAETSSLVAMEAASSGTPVIARRCGALPEIVEDGVTGFLADSVADMEDKLKLLPQISPGTCRQRASLRFSATRMAQDYLALYRRILAMGSAPHEALYGSFPLRKFQA